MNRKCLISIVECRMPKVVKIRNSKFEILTLCVCVFASPLVAKGPGGATANFLKLLSAPRGVAMGQAQCAIAEDVSSPLWNPAGLARIKSHEILLMHHDIVAGISGQYIGYAHPPSKTGMVTGAGLYYLSFGKMQSYDAVGIRHDEIGAWSGVGTVSFAGPFLSKNSQAGVTIKYLYESLDRAVLKAMAGDAGIIFDAGKWLKLNPWKDLRVGFAVQNMGSNAKFRDKHAVLPSSVKIGIGAKLPVYDTHLNLAADITVPNDRNPYTGIGAEYNVEEILSIRAGWRSNDDLSNGLSAGIGLKANFMNFDYAYVNWGDLGASHRFAITAKIGRKAILQYGINDIYQRAIKLYQEGRYAEATLEFHKVLQIDPGHENARRYIQKIYEKIKNK